MVSRKAQKAIAFVEHIKEHLKYDPFAEVMCKICHMTIEEIYNASKRKKENLE